MSRSPRAARLREREIIGMVQFGWYVLALIPIVLLFAASVMGAISALFVLPAMFAFLFWLFSLLFVLYGRRKYRNQSAAK